VRNCYIADGHIALGRPVRDRESGIAQLPKD
jgi:hypothetical protein